MRILISLIIIFAFSCGKWQEPEEQKKDESTHTVNSFSLLLEGKEVYFADPFLVCQTIGDNILSIKIYRVCKPSAIFQPDAFSCCE